MDRYFYNYFPHVQNYLLTITLLIILIFTGLVFAQEFPSEASLTAQKQHLPGYTVKSGKLLGSFLTNRLNCLGVTVVNNKIIVATGGVSATSKTDNYFYRFTMTGVLLDSFPQPSAIDGYGFRDLAFDGTYILASDNKEVKFIDTTNFQIHHSISHPTRTLHRGLAYDKSENAIWSLNSNSEPLYKINAATGEVIKSLATPFSGVFGIALEKSTAQGVMNLWYAEPWSTGRVIRLTKVDTSTGYASFSYDLSSNFNVDVCVGGLEIIYDHPAFPGKTVALLVEQVSGSIFFVELGFSPPASPASLTDLGGFGGWTNCAALKGNFAFLAQADKLNVIDFSSGKFSKAAELQMPAESNGYIIQGNYLYLYYPDYEDLYKNKIEIIDISNPLNPVSVSQFALTGVTKIKKIAVSESILLVQAEQLGEPKIFKLNISNPASVALLGTFSAPVLDMAFNGEFAFIISGNNSSPDTSAFCIYNISSGFNLISKTTIPNASYVYYETGKIHIACEGNKGYLLYNVSNPALPSFSGSFGVGGQSFNSVYAYGNYTFLQRNNSQMVILDNSNPSDIRQLSSKYYGFFTCSGVKDNYIYITAKGIFQSINISNPAVPAAGEKIIAPASASGMAINGNTMYCTEENEGLYIFDIANPEAPAYSDFITVASINKVYCYGNLLFITDQYQKIYFYDITDPFKPVYKSTFTARNMVRKIVRKGDYIFIVTLNSPKMDVINISDILLPVKTGEYTFMWNQYGIDLAERPNDNTIYAVSKWPSTISTNIELIDVSFPNSPRYINRTFDFENLVNLSMLDTYLVALESGRTVSLPRTTIYVLDPTDTVRIPKLSSIRLTNSSDGNGLFVIGNYIFASMAADHKLLSLGWDSKSKLLFNGPGITQFQPADNFGFALKNQQSGLGEKVLNTVKETGNDFGILYTINGEYIGSVLRGSKTIKITKIKQPVELPSSKKATITLGVQPETILVCPSDFWYQDSPSGIAKATKIACRFTITASIDDDWYVQSMKFKASGNGNELEDINYVQLRKQSGEIISKDNYKADDGTIEMAIRQVIPRGQSMTFIFEYCIKSSIKITTESKAFLVNTSVDWLSAEPLTLKEYEKLPPSGFTGNTIIVANVINERSKSGFAKLQQAIDSPQTTNGDVLGLCYCQFTEGANITKSLTVKSIDSLNKAFFRPDSSTDILMAIDADDVKIEGIEFTGSKVKCYIKNTSKKLKKYEIINNKFGLTGRGISFENTPAEGIITNNNFTWGGEPINLLNVGKVLISKNLFEQDNSGGKMSGIYIESCVAANQIANNTFNNIDEPISLKKSENNRIFKNELSNMFSSRKNRFLISDFSRDNQIFENKSIDKNGEIYVSDAGPNEIYNNDFGEISVYKSVGQIITANKVKQIWIGCASENTISENEITNAESYGIKLFEAGENIIKDNTISGSSEDGIVLIEGGGNLNTAFNSIIANKIFNNKKNGIFIDQARVNTFERNEIYENGKWGVLCGIAKGMDIHSLKFINNLFYKNHDGISISNSENCLIENCKIQHNEAFGVVVNNCSGLKILNNNISFQKNTGSALFLNKINNYEIKGNILGYNCSGIHISESEGGKIENNKIINNTCSNTGIWMSSSSPEMYGNNIINNNGAGIHAEMNSNPVIRGNNIYGNTVAGLNNATAGININANGNWWGTAFGPSKSDIWGGAVATNWLTSPVVLGCTKEGDSLYTLKGITDTGAVTFTNLSGAKDTITVTFTDEKGWLKGNLKQKMILDSANVEFEFVYAPPSGTADDTKNKILIKAEFNNSVHDDSLFVITYTPTLKTIVLTPDTSTIKAGDSLRFSWYALDQQGKEINPVLQWSATKGSIDSLGYFISDTTTGTARVTLKQQSSGIKDESVVIIAASEPILSRLEISPKEVTIQPGKGIYFQHKGYNQYGYSYSFMPVWAATGGTIGENGYYKADTIQGKFRVIVKDTGTGKADTATVYITAAIPVELISFMGKYTGKNVELSWQTATETNNMGFEILRSPRIESPEVEKEIGINEFVKAGYIAGKINSTANISYSFLDKTPLKNGIYKYRLKQIDLDGTVSYSETVKIEIKVLNYVLEQNYPNPFNPVTNIEYSIPVTGKVTIEVYNVLGERVSVLKEAVEEAGNYKVSWNGSRYASGVYVIRMQSAPATGQGKKFSSVRKMLLLK